MRRAALTALAVLAAAPAAAAAPPAPRVETMVVGKSRVLLQPTRAR